MYGGKATLKKCKIAPKFDLPDLIKLKRIVFPCTMDLTYKEIIRALNYADVYEILEDGTEVALDPNNFNKDNTPVEDPDDPDAGGGDEPTGEPEKFEVTGVGTAGVGKAKILK